MWTRRGPCRSPPRWSPIPSTRWRFAGSWTIRRSRDRSAWFRMIGPDRIEDLLREWAPQVLAALVRRHGQFGACEDAVQEALLAATLRWPGEGIPERPRSWLLTVASRTLIDAWRADSARRRRETAAATDPTGHAPAGSDQDDTLALVF